jgi:hypothetical protein
MDEDFLNAPFVQELPVALRQEFAQVIHEFDLAYQGPVHQSWTMDKLVDELTDRVFTFVRTTEQIGGASHYQAINVEHMKDGEPDKQRIEMRRFRAQSGVNELLYSHMRALEQLIEDSRQSMLVPLDPMSTKKINADKIQKDGPVDTAKIKQLEKQLKLNARDTKQLDTLRQRAQLLDEA